MAYDLEEQEQIAALKAWWSSTATSSMLAATAASAHDRGFQGWRYYQHTQTAAALTLYEQLERAQRADEQKKVRDIAAQIVGQLRLDAVRGHGGALEREGRLRPAAILPARRPS